MIYRIRQGANSGLQQQKLKKTSRDFERLQGTSRTSTNFIGLPETPQDFIGVQVT
jgi:hypothetical protein